MENRQNPNTAPMTSAACPAARRPSPRTKAKARRARTVHAPMKAAAANNWRLAIPPQASPYLLAGRHAIAKSASPCQAIICMHARFVLMSLPAGRQPERIRRTQRSRQSGILDGPNLGLVPEQIVAGRNPRRNERRAGFRLRLDFDLGE